jgi:hypothetical protein
MDSVVAQGGAAPALQEKRINTAAVAGGCMPSHEAKPILERGGRGVGGAMGAGQGGAGWGHMGRDGLGRGLWGCGREERNALT